MIIKVFLFLMIIGVVSYFELKRLRENNMKKEIILFLSLLLFSSTLFILERMGVAIINPLDGLKFTFEPVGKAIEAILIGGG
ncbi:hypothetical protein IMZ08_04565 [Bacillus luteolus]|uniref:Uncharacterized protein n=1 Tax=Litchfieldia luteola TaxID=682179 RepID=A0ABR9QFT7_9BACI|nr:hypothetical protein [Cytobacillus luteolus]MBE4907333.1 hypothetical protein [Cytobacillus luteolus]MBP1943880.1 hypothetical protein [Cytobacillus luteolus]